MKKRTPKQIVLHYFLWLYVVGLCLHVHVSMRLVRFIVFFVRVSVYFRSVVNYALID